MPKWGLTVEQRETQPWGIDKAWLAPAKTVTDPVHGDIHLTELESALLDTPPMQRLRRVRQLGTSHLVYPGATHSRFSHALGTLRAAQDLIDAVVAAMSGPRPPEKSLLADWQAEGSEPIPGQPGRLMSMFDKHLAEATVLARLGGLLHDLCHVPLGHTIEDDLGVLTPHDAGSRRFDKLWRQIPTSLREVLGKDLTDELRPLILSDEPGDRPPGRYPFVKDIVGNTICADLIDYIQRDHKATGLPLALGNRFVDDFYVTNRADVYHAEHMVVRISRHGQLRHDVVTELVKYLRYRYELSERVLYHHAKISVDAMIGKLLEMWSDALWVDEVSQRHPSLVAEPADAESVSKLQERVARTHGEDAVKAIDAAVSDQLEDKFLSWSDDGLLEYLWSSTSREAGNGNVGASRLSGIAHLSRMVLDRRLFKSVGRAASEADLASAKATYAKFGSPAGRRALEEGAASFAGIKPRWKVVLWVPGPKMRMKEAEVLVDRDGRVAPLAEMVSATTEGSLIVEKHRHLWGVGVYAHPDVEDEWRKQAVLAWLKDEMGLAFLDASGEPVPSAGDLIADTLSEELGLTAGHRQRVRQLVDSSGMGGGRTFAQILMRVDVLRKGEQIVPDMALPDGKYL